MLNINREMNSVWMKENALYTKAASKLGVGRPEMMVLYALVTMGDQTQKQIAEQFGMQKQTVNTVVRRLKQDGYLMLSSENKDKREKIVALTAEGKIYAQNIVEPLLNAENTVYQKIGEERIRKMQETLDMFNVLFEKEIERGL
ncbi:MAG: MarR family winged helix-turn-helix transcriptional regulator [Coprococcus sp.]